MKTPNNTSALQAIAKCLGKPLAWVLRKQIRLIEWLASKGLPLKAAKWLIIVIDLFILVNILLFILPHWVVVIAGFFYIFAYLGVDIDLPPPKEPEWRNGSDGYGLYNDIGWRLDGSSEDEE